ncbi:hypothetical protein [Nostoc sp. DedQUE07]|nr:hypothetical protein [Nostoc sp. DedQUE07]MDZ8132453.1 hypothetical protein [Nostoc sp. DedQUE07]
MDAIVKRSHTLKQALVDFVLDADGELAQALDIYVAAQMPSGNGDRSMG